MRLIDKIEINYFRSIYQMDLKKLSDVNVFVGKNDAGKSNILRALNLFFNNQTGDGQPFNFEHDLSLVREEEARNAKGRMTIWVKVHFNNVLGWSSLPDKFAIKKSWNRYGSDPDQEVTPKSIPSTSIGRFLNKVKYFYVPTLRGPDVLSNFLTLLYDALAEQHSSTLTGSAEQLASLVKELTSSMSGDLKTHFGFDSEVRMPEDLREIFKRLEFSTRDSDVEIPLRFRGDGIQSSHIPLILDFISKNVSHQVIWGFEEPENSLEMGRCYELANEFRKFAKSNQIFLTTHSPAFYDVGSGSNSTRWLVRKEQFDEAGLRMVTETSSISETTEVDQQIGLSALISERSKDVFEKVSKLEKETFELNEKVKNAQKPAIIVEGVHDATIFSAADKDGYFEIVPGSNAESVSSYILTMSRTRHASPKPIIGIVDADDAGFKAIRNFSKFKVDSDSRLFVIDKERHFYLGTLPVSEHLAQAKKAVGSEEKNVGMPIEFFFSPEAIDGAVKAGALKLQKIEKPVVDSQAKFNLSEALEKLLPDEIRYFAYRPDEASKKDFADWVIADETRLKPLIDFIENLKKLAPT